MKTRLSALLAFLALALSARAGSLVEGVVYLKDGTTAEFAGNDRIRLSKKHGDLKAFRDVYLRTKSKTTYRFEQIDSVVCRNAHAETERTRKFIPAPTPGWMWVYFETPRMRVCVYSGKGYGVASNGGIQIRQRRGYFTRSRTGYYLQKNGAEAFERVGSASGRPNERFRKRIARYIADDPELAGRILGSNTYRDKTVLMLRDYAPTK